MAHRLRPMAHRLHRTVRLPLTVGLLRTRPPLTARHLPRTGLHLPRSVRHLPHMVRHLRPTVRHLRPTVRRLRPMVRRRLRPTARRLRRTPRRRSEPCVRRRSPVRAVAARSFSSSSERGATHSGARRQRGAAHSRPCVGASTGGAVFHRCGGGGSGGRDHGGARRGGRRRLVLLGRPAARAAQDLRRALAESGTESTVVRSSPARRSRLLLVTLALGAVGCASSPAIRAAEQGRFEGCARRSPPRWRAASSAPARPPISRARSPGERSRGPPGTRA